MDRPLDSPTVRRLRLRRILSIGLPAALLLALALRLPGWISPSVERARLRTAVVERGAIAATVTASGNVVPVTEHVLASPIDTRLTRRLKAVGDSVRAGEPVVELDTSEARLALARLEEHIALKRNECEQKKLDQEEALHDLESRLEIKTLELRSLELVHARNQQYFEIGGISQAALDASVVDVERARLELAQLEQQIEHARRRASTQTEKLDLELRLLQQEREQARRELELATARANHDGVITWLPSIEGQSLRRGEEIARIADLSAFRVEARLSDAYADCIAAGQPARIQVGEELLPGRVVSVYPAVEAGIVRLLLDLDSGDHPRLRANLRVEAHLVVEERAEALKVKRGAFVTADGRPAVFVVDAKVARRRTVQFGIADFEEIEVLAGLEAGDEVILSDMNDYAHLQEVKLR